MAHIVVYLQRTPQGLHPASAVALCLARDVGSDRGASVTAVCSGDAGAFDRGIVASAGRFGADVVLFCGPHGLENLRKRLRPVHVLVPWTPEGLAAAQGLPTGPVIPRWLDRKHPTWGVADALCGIIAGTLPWHDLPQVLDAEYEGDVDDIPLPPWIPSDHALEDSEPPTFQVQGEGGVGYIAPDGLDASVQQRLHALAASPATLSEVASNDSGTYLWLAPGLGAVPDALAGRGPGSRLILLPGPDGEPDPSWSFADWVFGGPWPDVLDQLVGGPWRTAHG